MLSAQRGRDASSCVSGGSFDGCSWTFAPSEIQTELSVDWSLPSPARQSKDVQTSRWPWPSRPSLAWGSALCPAGEVSGDPNRQDLGRPSNRSISLPTAGLSRRPRDEWESAEVPLLGRATSLNSRALYLFRRQVRLPKRCRRPEAGKSDSE
ncbi:hypothetical protein FKM82_027232 [Ascaphus truei]